MGGHISVGVRRRDGSFRTIGVWTNLLNRFLREKAFRIEGSLEPLDRFFARYLKDDADFGGPQETVPGEYGFVLIDEMTRTLTTMNSYSSPQWVTQTDLGHVSGGRIFATEEALAEMAEMREAAIQARYFICGQADYTVEDLPNFTTHEKMFSLMDEMTRRGNESIAQEKAAAALDALQAAIDAIDASGEGPQDHAYEAKMIEADAAVRIVNDALIRRNFVEYAVGFPAWKIIDLFPETEENFRRMQAAVESCVTLTTDEREAWRDEYDRRFGERLLGTGEKH